MSDAEPVEDHRRRPRAEWERDDDGAVKCAALTAGAACGTTETTWMRCPTSGTESPVCSYHRRRYEITAALVDCIACGQEHVRIAEHYEFWPLDSEEPGAIAPQT